MRIFNLQNKLIQIRHKISKQDSGLMTLKKEEFEALINAELIKQVADYAMKQFKIETKILNEDEVEFNGRGYILTERDMLNALYEVTQLDEVGMRMLVESLEKQLGLKKNPT